MGSSILTRLTVVTCAGALTACSADPSSPALEKRPPDLYVGSVEGTDAIVAVLVDGSDSAAYVCGGPETYATMTAWFANAVSAGGDGMHLHASSGGEELTATLADDRVAGSIVVQGTSHPFTAAIADDGTGAALYSTMDNGCRTGLVVPPASVGDAQGVWCAESHALTSANSMIFAQVTPIRPWVRGGASVRVEVSPAGLTPRELSLAAVVLPLP